MAFARLTVGLFQGPREPRILICGSTDALLAFAKELRRLGSGATRSLDFADFADVRGSLRFRAACRPDACRKACIATPYQRDATSFEWVLDEEICLELAEKTERLAATRHGHQYLFVDATDDAEIVLSEGEYDEHVFDDAG